MSERSAPTVVIVAGVTGAGKSTVGARLADALGAQFLDADTLHADEAIAKMKAGTPLTDQDRAPWLAAIAAHLRVALETRVPLVVACSALKRSYRRTLDPNGSDEVLWVFLQGQQGLLAERLAARSGHFMDPALLNSQYDTYEPPDAAEHAMLVDVTASPDTIVQTILARLPHTAGAPGVMRSAAAPPDRSLS